MGGNISPLNIPYKMDEVGLVVSCGTTNMSWSLETHTLFPKDFRSSIEMLFLAFKRWNESQRPSLRMPKVLLKEIAKTLAHMVYGI